MGAIIDVPVRVCLLSVDCCHFSSFLYEDIQEGSSISLMYLMEGLWLLRCWWKFSSASSPSFKMTKVSSTYLSQVCGLTDAVDRASSSKCSMYKLAIMGERGFPMAAPSLCS